MQWTEKITVHNLLKCGRKELTYKWKCKNCDSTLGAANGNIARRVCKYTSNSFCLFSTKLLEFLPIIFLGGNIFLSIFFAKTSYKRHKLGWSLNESVI